MIYLFGDYELDTTLYELRDAGEPLQAGTTGIQRLGLSHSASRAGCHPRGTPEHLWPGLMTSETLLNNCIMEARKAVADSGQAATGDQTLHGRGYRFIAPTTELAWQTPASCHTYARSSPRGVTRLPSQGHVAPGMRTLDGSPVWGTSKMSWPVTRPWDGRVWGVGPGDVLRWRRG